MKNKDDVQREERTESQPRHEEQNKFNQALGTNDFVLALKIDPYNAMDALKLHIENLFVNELDPMEN